PSSRTRALHSFPTRRSSDLFSPKPSPTATPFAIAMTFLTEPPSSVPTTSGFVYGRKYGVRHACWTNRAVSSSVHATTVAAGWRRSEEHTSELQSRGHLVCRL